MPPLITPPNASTNHSVYQTIIVPHLRYETINFPQLQATLNYFGAIDGAEIFINEAKSTTTT